MQNIIRRTQRAVVRADRRNHRKTVAAQKHEKRKYIEQLQQKRTKDLQDVKAARKARMEDWNLGPLAPNRAVGRGAAKYGALEREQLQGVQIPEFMRRKVWPIVEGDRVLVTKGVDKGRIGVVRQVWKERDSVTVDGLNMAYVDGSLFDNEPDSTPQAKRESEVPIPYSDLRLVHKWTDPRTSQTKDVVVEKIDMRPLPNFQIDPETGERLYARFIPGVREPIPWPEKPDPEIIDHDVDTLRMTVEEKTFIPTLLIPPMPETAIDELRSKYSKFRTRHDEDYVQKMAELDTTEEKQEKLLAQMRTPLQEYKARQQEAKKQAPPKVLTDQMLARIGQVMAASRFAPKPSVKVDRD